MNRKEQMKSVQVCTGQLIAEIDPTQSRNMVTAAEAPTTHP